MKINKSSKVLIGTIAITALAALTAPAFARGGGVGAGESMGVGAGGMSNSHISTQGSLNTNGPNATDRDFGRDRAEDRANANANLGTHTSQRDANSNGPTATDRDRGYDRAQDRMNSSGTQHNQAETHVNGSATTDR